MVHEKFGRLQQRTRQAMAKNIFAFVFFACLCLFVAVLAYPAKNQQSQFSLVDFCQSCFFAILGASILIVGTLSLRNGLLVFEKGIVHVSLRGERAISFSQIEALRVRSVETYINGFYDHTKKTIEIILKKGPPVRCSLQVKRNDDSVEEVRDSISFYLANELHARLKRSGGVEWVPGVNIMAEALSVQGVFSHGSAGLRSILLNSNMRFGFQDGACNIFVEGVQGPVLTLDTSEINFWPGLALVHRICYGRQVHS